jgi:hypothetical protein
MTQKGKGAGKSSGRDSKGHRTGSGKGRGGAGKNNKGGNPTGITISEAMELYGASDAGELVWKMKLNPANTLSFSSLIDDKETVKETEVTEPVETTTTDTMSNINWNDWINKTYKEELFRDATDVAYEYWGDQLAAGASQADVLRGIRSSQEKIELNQSVDDWSKIYAAKGWGLYSDPEVQKQIHQDARQDTTFGGTGWTTKHAYPGQGMPYTYHQSPAYQGSQGSQGSQAGSTDSSYMDSINNTLNSITDAWSQMQKDNLQFQTDLTNAWSNMDWGQNQGPVVSGVKTQNELPGYQSKTGGASGYFGRGSNFGLTSSSLNI